jgi:hypothetical protein
MHTENGGVPGAKSSRVDARLIAMPAKMITLNQQNFGSTELGMKNKRKRENAPAQS